MTSPANERGSSPLLPWLHARYAEEHGGADFPVPTELILAQHTRVCAKCPPPPGLQRPRSPPRRLLGTRLAARRGGSPWRESGPLGGESGPLGAHHRRLGLLERAAFKAVTSRAPPTHLPRTSRAPPTHLPPRTSRAPRRYVVHAIARSNTTHCFGELLMGQGRLPVPPYEQDAHFAALGKALNIAVLRDFGPENCTIQGVPVSVALVEQMAREHSRLLFLQQQIFSNHLAEANRLGEVGRKDEMKRIFNIDI